MKKIWSIIAKDLWIVMLDVIAVNLSYFLALIVRFFVNNALRPIAVDRYMPAYTAFAPFYTVLALMIFAVFKLYGGMWRYAGINDMNRIILASICTMVVYIAGSAAFFTRMPITVYIIGGVLQFFFVACTRFAYRILLIEKKKIHNRSTLSSNSLIVGIGELGRRVIRDIEDSETFKPVCVIDPENGSEGRMIDGIPVVGMDELETVVKKYKIQNVFIADSELTIERRSQLRNACETKGIIVQDYTGAISNQDASVSVTALLELTHCPIILHTEDEDFEFENNREALLELTDRYSITSVKVEDNKLVLDLRKSQLVSFSLEDEQPVAYVGYDAWSRRK